MAAISVYIALATLATSACAFPAIGQLSVRSHTADGGYPGISQTKVNGMIAGGAVGAFIVICLIIWGVWKWRHLITGAWRRRRPNDRRVIDPLGGFGGYYGDYKRPGSFMSENRSGMLFGSSHDLSREQIVDRLTPPPPALAPSNTSLRRQVSERRQLVRESMLDEKHKQRLPISQTFFLEDDDTLTEKQTEPKRRKSSAGNLTIQIPQPSSEEHGTFYFPPPPIPDSPEAAHGQSRFSWTSTNNDNKSKRSSVESEPARYRTVDSWVSHQVSRTLRDDHSDERATKTSQSQQPIPDPLPTGSVPSTPAAFRHHPGAPVSFIARHKRLESADIDRQL